MFYWKEKWIWFVRYFMMIFLLAITFVITLLVVYKLKKMKLRRKENQQTNKLDLSTIS